MHDLHCCVALKYFALHNIGPIFGVFQREEIGNPKGTRKMFEGIRKSIAKHNRYQRMVTEIRSLTDRDLADFNGNRDEMLRAAYQAVYGH